MTVEEPRKGWRRVNLKDVCREITVGHVGPMATEYVDEGIPFLRSQNVQAFRVELSELKYVSPHFHRRLKKSAIGPGDVLVVRTGYPGTACVVPESLSVANCADLVIIRPSAELDSRFLADVFNSAWGRGTVAGKLVGVAQQHFNIGAARELLINLPPLPTQRRIASILSAYDDLIENNTRRIAILEEMARALYREWFVHFRFPGHEKVKMMESPLGPIPQGWEVRKVKALIKRLTSGRVYKDADVSSVGAVPVVDQARGDFLGFHDNAPDHVASAEQPIVVFGDHTCKMQLMIEPFSVGPNVVPFASANDQPILFLYFLARDLVETREYKRHWTELTNKTVVVAPHELSLRFAAITLPMLQQATALTKTNLNLVRTRDLLLPKLISGEINVSESDIAVQEEIA